MYLLSRKLSRPTEFVLYRKKQSRLGEDRAGNLAAQAWTKLTK